MDRNHINNARALYYGVLATFFSFIEDETKIESLQKALGVLEENAINEHVENSIRIIQTSIFEEGFHALQKESNEIFFSPYDSYIPMTASFYQEDRDDGKLRMKMLDYVLHSSFRRDEKKFKENEDHISFILEFMQNLLIQSVQSQSKCGEEIAKSVFINVLNVFVDDFIVSLYKHKRAALFKEVAIIFQIFIELERAYLDVVSPTKETKSNIVTLDKKVTKPFTKRIERNMDEIKL